MDVICQQCSTEYEFDETLIAERGTTVKCTNCGHLFKVFRSGGGDARPWQIRHGDGTIETLASLRALQKRITSGSLTVDDEVARQGDPYKPLGSIAELESFFAQARENQAAEQPAAPPVQKSKGTLLGYQHAPSEPPEPIRAPALNQMAGAEPEPEPAPAPVAPAPAPAPAPKGRTQPEIQQTRRSPDVPPEPLPTRQRVQVEPPLDPAYDEPVNIKGLGKRSGGGIKWGRWFMLLLIGGLIGVGVWKKELVLEQYQALTGAGGSPAARFMESAREHLAQDDGEGYDQAIHELTRATAVAERDPDVLSSLSRAHALKAQLLEFDAQDLERDAAEHPERAGEAAGIRRIAQDAARSARRMAEDAFRIAPESVDAEIALADAQRLTGDLTGARTHYDAAAARMTPRSAELLRVGALLAAAEADSMAAAKDLAQQAVEADGDLIRARIVLARALVAENNLEGARAHVTRILSAHREHPRAVAVRRLLDGEAPRPTQTTPTAEPATPEEGDAEAATPTTDEAPGAETESAERGARQARDDRPFDEMAAGDDTAEHDDGRPPEGRDYSWYVREGDSALRSGSMSRAEAYYHAALEVRPGSSEAMTGMGHVALRGGRAEEALTRFRRASRNGYGPAFIGLGKANERLGRRRDAIQAYEDYLARSPNGGMAATARQRLEALRGGGSASSSSSSTSSDSSSSSRPSSSMRSREEEDSGDAYIPPEERRTPVRRPTTPSSPPPPMEAPSRPSSPPPPSEVTAVPMPAP